MSSNQEVMVREDAGVVLSADEVHFRVKTVQEIKRRVMQKGVHYGQIPGTDKDSLWQAGAEVLRTAFGIAVKCEPIEERVTDEEVSYRVRATAYSIHTGRELGVREAICSTREKKYRWRRPVHIKEWEATPDHMRRLTWDKQGNEVLQVRTEPGDLMETILAMANKRADVAVTRAVTGCSDMFGLNWEEDDDAAETKEPVHQPRPAAQEAAQQAESGTLPLGEGGPAAVKVTSAKKVKSGTSDSGKDWTLFAVKTSDGSEYVTFDSKIAAAAMKAQAEQADVRISSEPNGEGKSPRIVELVRA